MKLLLADDGSADSSLAICRAYARADARVHVLSAEHAGVSAARNRALDAARGEYIMFCDSDDVASPDWMGHLVAELEQNSSTVMAVCNWITAESGYVNRNITASRVLPVCEALELYREAHLYYLWNKAYRASAVRFDTSLDYAEDDVYNLDYLLAQPPADARISLLDESLYYHGMQSPSSLANRTQYDDAREQALIGRCSQLVSRYALTETSNPVFYSLARSYRAEAAFKRSARTRSLRGMRQTAAMAEWKDYVNFHIHDKRRRILETRRPALILAYQIMTEYKHKLEWRLWAARAK